MFGIVEIPTRYRAATTTVTINIEEISVKMHLKMIICYAVRAAF
jgi:hypothetical protein